MDPVAFDQLAGFLGGGFALIAGTGLVMLCFPSIRAAFVERVRPKAMNRTDAAELAAQLAALRGEVYALRNELAQAVGALPASHEHRQLAGGAIIDATRGRQT